MLGDMIPTCENNWSPVAMGEKGKAKMNGPQAFSPVGLKVLVVDDNRVCLAVLEKMLQQCNYSVTTCTSAAEALALVQGNSISFDLVLCDVHMPGMDGFKLLEAIVLERDLPVIMMSSDDETDVVMKGITQGACDYFLKPVCLQRLQTIWQHVFRRREMGDAARDSDYPDTDIGRASKFSAERDNCRKRKGKEEAMDDPIEFVNNSKKKRLVWTPILHKQFVDAVKNLGTANAVPKQILEKMNVKGISRENVASHLQKYRKYLTDQEAGYDDAKDLAASTMSHFKLEDTFSGSIEIQPGALSTPPFTLSSLHAPQSLTTQNLTPQNLNPQNLTPQNLNPQNLTPQNLTPQNLTPQNLSLGYSLNTELYPVPSQSFQAVDEGNFRLSLDQELFSVPSLDVASSSNFIQRGIRFPGLVDVFPPTLVPPAFYNNTDYHS